MISRDRWLLGRPGLAQLWLSLLWLLVLLIILFAPIHFVRALTMSPPILVGTRLPPGTDFATVHASDGNRGDTGKHATR